MVDEHGGPHPDIIEHQYPVNYSQRGVSLEGEGLNRSVNVALPTWPSARLRSADAGRSTIANVTGGEDLLPGQTNADAPDGPNDEINTGYLWNNALRAALRFATMASSSTRPAITNPMPDSSGA